MRAAEHDREPLSLESAAAADSPAETRPVTPNLWTRIAGRAQRARPRRFARVPTHVVGVPCERRGYPRAKLRLPLRLKRVAGQRALTHLSLATENISSSGVYFLSPRLIETGTPIEVEILLVRRPHGQGSVHMITLAEVVRTEPAHRKGWHAIAASFDEITFQRDERIPARFRKT